MRLHRVVALLAAVALVLLHGILESLHAGAHAGPGAPSDCPLCIFAATPGVAPPAPEALSAPPAASAFRSKYRAPAVPAAREATPNGPRGRAPPLVA